MTPGPPESSRITSHPEILNSVTSAVFRRGGGLMYGLWASGQGHLWGAMTLPPGNSQQWLPGQSLPAYCTDSLRDVSQTGSVCSLSVTVISGSQHFGMSDVQEKWRHASLEKGLPIFQHIYIYICRTNVLDIFLVLTQAQKLKLYPTEFQHLGPFGELKRYSQPKPTWATCC